MHEGHFSMELDDFYARVVPPEWKPSQGYSTRRGLERGQETSMSPVTGTPTYLAYSRAIPPVIRKRRAVYRL